MFRALGYGHRYVISHFWTHNPILLTHSLTSKCNCRCKICYIWREKNSAHEMKTHEIFKMLDEARRLNFVAYLAFGGEPLMRPDALDVLKHAHDLGLYTSIVTNGTHLPDKAEEIAKVVDLTWVSLDYYSDYHDEMRGLKGAFDSAMEGIMKLRKEDGKIAINCVLSKLNANAVGKMAELAKDLRVKLAFDPMEIFPGTNEEYALSHSECRRLFSEVLELKKRGYPILNSYEFLKNLINPMEYSCAQPRVFIKVYENGEIAPFWCQRNNRVFGNLCKQGLGDVIRSAPFKEFAKMANVCNFCKNSSTVEVSMFYSPQRFLRNCFKIPNPIVEFIAAYI
jgi:MoaA/NifB/PqqE/SkfB family radical SAM enzyme